MELERREDRCEDKWERIIDRVIGVKEEMEKGCLPYIVYPGYCDSVLWNQLCLYPQ